jgi:16S rRNA (adenine1518-N6/adenine1519-N6)-dimethyltransferase
MDLTLPENIKKILRDCGVKPSKEMGQNFLASREVLEKMVDAAALRKDDQVLEIGPGLGVLTAELAKKVKRVVAVEADRRLVAALGKTMVDYKNVEIIQEDILKFSISNFQFSNKFQIQNSKSKILDTGYEIPDTKFQNYEYKIVANLPYQITSAIFRKFLNDEPRPAEIIVMVQKEVAERICAPAGETSLLSLSVQFFGQPEIVEIVPRNVFWPEPEVDSAILRVSLIKETSGANLKKIDPEKFFKIAKIGFSARRKQLHNNLSGGLGTSSEKVKEIFLKFGFNPRIRAQDLSLDDWIGLALVLG